MEYLWKLIMNLEIMHRLQYVNVMILLWISLQCVTTVNPDDVCPDKVVHECKAIDNSTLSCIGYIPNNVPWNTRTVFVNCLDIPEIIFIKNGSFHGLNWNKVETLRISGDGSSETPLNVESGAFTGLERLRELQLSIVVTLQIGSGTFEGLEYVTTLSMSGCKRLDDRLIIQSFKPNTSLPRLEVLDLSFVGMYRFKLKVDGEFLAIFKNRPIKSLILRGTAIQSLNQPDLQHVCNTIELDNLDLTDAIIDYMPHDISVKVVCKNIKSLDVTGVTFPRSEISCIFSRLVANLTNVIIKLNTSMLAFFGLENLTLNRLCPDNSPKQFINISDITFITGQRLALKRIKVCDNNIQVLDIRKIYASLDIEHYVFCNNSLEYINHGAVQLFSTTLKYLDFSGNNLFEMILKDPLEFKLVFASLYNLRVLNLSRNKFTTLPPDLFLNNSNLQEVDLSNNRLADFQCMFPNHSGIQFLDLSSNLILTLDVTSQAIDLIVTQGTMSAFVDISLNPLRCSKCVDVTSVRWLLQTNAVIDKNALRCSTGQVGIKEPLSISIQNQLQFECKLPMIITTSIAAPLALFVAVCVATYVAIRRKRAHKRMELKEGRIQDLREGDENKGNKYAAFILYNDDDDTLVKDMLYPGLESLLSLKVGIERDLVSFLDTDSNPSHSRMGCYKKLIRESSVIVVLLTNHGCTDKCVHLVLKSCFPTGEETDVPKPIIYVVKGDEDIRTLPEDITIHYRSARKVLWREGSDNSAKELECLSDLIIDAPIDYSVFKNITVRNNLGNIFKNTDSNNRYIRL